jgi:hypothetical protein
MLSMDKIPLLNCGINIVLQIVLEKENKKGASQYRKRL